jgi:hypothetical protein
MRAADDSAVAATNWRRESFLPAAIEVFTLEDALIKETTSFVMPEAFPRFGLPPALEPE